MRGSDFVNVGYRQSDVFRRLRESRTRCFERKSRKEEKRANEKCNKCVEIERLHRRRHGRNKGQRLYMSAIANRMYSDD